MKKIIILLALFIYNVYGVVLEDINVKAKYVRDNYINDISLNKKILKNIDILPINSVSDVLRLNSDIFLLNEGIFGNRAVGSGRLKIRGQNIKLLIDNRPVSMEVFNCIIGNVLNKNNISKMEIIKGGESVLYGSDGLGGIINIETPDPEKSMTNINVFYGTFNSQDFSFSNGNKINKFSYYTNYDFKKTDGHIENSKLESKDFFLKLKYEFDKNISLSISNKIFVSDHSDPIEKVMWNQKRYGYNIIFKNKNYILQLYKTDGKHKSDYISTGLEKFRSSDFLEGIRTSYLYSFYNFNFLGGFDYKKYGGEIYNQMWTNDGEFKLYEYAPYSVLKFNLPFGFKSIYGIRYNYNELYKGIVIHKLGIEKQLSKKIKYNIGVNRSFRTPSVLQTQIHKFKKNDLLMPEKVWNYEFDLYFNKINNTDYKISVYKMTGKNRIVDMGSEFRNVDTYRHWGITFDITKNITENLEYYLSYNYLNTGLDTDFEYRNKIVSYFKQKNKKIENFLEFIYVNELYASANKQNRLPDFLQVDLKTKFNLNKNFDFFIQCNNILNNDIALQYDFSANKKIYMPGITVFTGFNIKWN